MRDQDATRAAIVAEARTWISTKFHHAADIKGVGVDCAMLLVRVFCDLGLVPRFDPRPYSPDWMLHRGEEKFLGFLLARGVEVKEPMMGDVALMKVGRCYAHGAIVTVLEPLTILHAFAPYGRVIEEHVRHKPEIALAMKTARFASIVGAA